MKKATINCDGASLGNPGEAGIGVYLRYDDKTYEISQYIGTATNNVAEYRAFITGLQRAQLLGAEAVDVYLDSELVVRQIEGKYKVKNEALKELHQIGLKLARSFKKFSITHVPREQNKEADRLACKGAKGEQETASQEKKQPDAQKTAPSDTAKNQPDKNDNEPKPLKLF